MNIVYSLLIVIGLLLIVKPAEAENNLLVGNIIPAVMNSSLKIPFFPVALANSEIQIKPIKESNVRGMASLVEVPQNLDTKIILRVSGLEPGEQYVPIYYQNSDCTVEISSFDKLIQGAFIANEQGEGGAEDIVKDSINRIGSISIRRAQDFELIACGRI